MDGENNMIYMDGKAEVSEDKEFIFTLNFYHYNVKQAAGKPVTVPPSQRELENIAGILQSYHLKTILSR